MLRKLILAGASIALLTGTAAAQFPMPSMKLGGDKPPPTAEEVAKQRALDRAYKAAQQKIPEKRIANDPWGGIRPDPAVANRKSP